MDSVEKPNIFIIALSGHLENHSSRPAAENNTEISPEINSGIKSEINPGIKSEINPGIKSEINPGIKSEINPGINPGISPGNDLGSRMITLPSGLQKPHGCIRPIAGGRE